MGERSDGFGEGHDVVVTGHVLHGEVFSAVAHVDVALVFDEIRVGPVVQGGEFLDVGVAHVDALHERVTAHDAGVERGQQVDCLLKLVPCTAVPLGATHVVEHLLVGRIDRDVELGGERIEVLEHLGQRAVGHQHRRHAMLVAQIHVLGQSGVEGGLPVQGNRDVFWVLSVQPFLPGHLGVATEAREQAALGAYRFVEQVEGVLVG